MIPIGGTVPIRIAANTYLNQNRSGNGNGKNLEDTRAPLNNYVESMHREDERDKVQSVESRLIIGGDVKNRSKTNSKQNLFSLNPTIKHNPNHNQ